MKYFVDVILPLPLPKPFTYEINLDEAKFIKPGMRIAVPFGKSKIITGLAQVVHDIPPETYETKEIYQILDNEPIVNEIQLKLWEWMASYYLCTQGEILRAALPGTLLLESETKIFRTTLSIDETVLNDDEYQILEALDIQPVLNINDLSNILNKKNVISVIKSLLQKKLVEVDEVLEEGYKPKWISLLSLHPDLQVEAKFKSVLGDLAKATKQKEAFLQFITVFQRLQKPVNKHDLVKDYNIKATVIKALIEKNILFESKVRADRMVFEQQSLLQSKDLSKEQMTALQQIKSGFEIKDVCLLFGVTSSGKTEIYVELIREVIASGKQVLYLLPEIALTTQIVSRLRSYFGDKIGVYHSKYNQSERVETWQNLLHNSSKGQIIVGARSAVFLPFSNLGLVVIDEEHEVSFKQFDPAPRYQARDAAIYLAKLHQSKVLLGTATPSLESFFNTQTGKYQLVELQNRFGEFQSPETIFVDLREKYHKKLMKGHFSDSLILEIQEALSEKQKVILFKNRRGFAPVIECKTCGNVPYCPNCDVSLTYHQQSHKLRCHYCGYATQMPDNCFACGSVHLDAKGFGTEQVEDEVRKLFPEANVARMDSDTTKGKKGFDKIIHAFDSGEIDILIGTQMLSKGLDFRNIALVGVLQADDLLHHPDFRAHEHCFQLLRQVSGRVGRGDLRGKVMIQTFNPEHEVLQQVGRGDFREMFENQLRQRQEFKYPPYFKIIKIVIKHRDYDKVHLGANWFAEALHIQLNMHVLGPESPGISRIRNEHIKHVIVKLDANKSTQLAKNQIFKLKDSLLAVRDFRSLKISLDVDNY